MDNELALWREEIRDTVLSAVKGVRAVNQMLQDATQRIDILEDQMKKRIYVSPAHKNLLQKAVNNHVRALLDQYGIEYKVGSKKVFQALWRSLKDKYSISVYGEIPDIEFDNALDFIRHWEDETLLNRLKVETAA
jgi:hypothetical protein